MNKETKKQRNKVAKKRRIEETNNERKNQRKQIQQLSVVQTKRLSNAYRYR